MSVNEVNIQLDATTATALELAAGPLQIHERAAADAARREALLGTMTPVDARAIRSLLSGRSVIDWRRLSFNERDEVVRFLDANGFDVHRPLELGRLRELHRRALEYVAATWDLPIPATVRDDRDLCQLFLLASAPGGDEQRAACVVLKVMHVINHLEARRLIHHLNVSERALYDAAGSKVDEFVQRMHRDGLGVIGYVPSKKTDHSLVTKLISKPRVTAAQIFDKLRFRLTTRERADIVPVILWLTRHLFPFNHVVPGETHNTILDEEALARTVDSHFADSLPLWDEGSDIEEPNNPMTSDRFRMVNFVVELPVRVSRIRHELPQRLDHLGHVVLVALEFQLFDRATAEDNERGDSSHAAYKQRQLDTVSRRLWGAGPPPMRPR
ncbi:MAG: TIGR04552 family protein [Deltaproteobacteria bacterium]|nr:TIGR04552 family protein [Deltaproteobacteria bacterium]MCB9786058.1 TIGR04552 family protein [Deltaproteobacteria bacterium]